MSIPITDQQIVNKMIEEIPRNEWGLFVNEHLIRVQALADYANKLSVLAAEISAYLEHRGALGCGDNGHTGALEEAQKTRKRVRKALGYACP